VAARLNLSGIYWSLDARRRGIIIPSAELLAQLTGRLNGFKYSARRVTAASALRERLSSLALGRSMEREIHGRSPSTAAEKFFYGSIPDFYRAFFPAIFFSAFMKLALHARPAPTYAYWAFAFSNLKMDHESPEGEHLARRQNPGFLYNDDASGRYRLSRFFFRCLDADRNEII